MKRSAWQLRVAATHPALAGHFPGQPIVPGVMLLDETVNALERELSADGAASSHRPQIQNVKFHRPVRPEETLQLQYEVRGGVTHFELLCGEARIVTGALSLAGTADDA